MLIVLGEEEMTKGRYVEARAFLLQILDKNNFVDFLPTLLYEHIC